jgi:integrase
MGKKATGQLYENRTRRGVTYGLRFRTRSGERAYETLGRSWEGMSRTEADRAAEDLLARVRLGIYRTRAERGRERAEREAAREEVPCFGPFAEGWYSRRCDLGGKSGNGLSASGRADLRNQLDRHLLPWFAGFRLDEIDVEEVERYAAAKRRALREEGGIGSTYLNKTLQTLRAILRDAVRYGRISRNVAEDVRVVAPRFNGSHLDSAEQITALLTAAGELDQETRQKSGHARALLAVLTLAGLRIGEALSLRWDDVNLATGVLRVRGTKTAAAERTVTLLPLLRDELVALKARTHPDRSALVFGTSRGGKDSPSNVRRRKLAKAVERADANLAKEDRAPLPDKLTPHSLRRTFASLLVALGRDPRYVMAQMGHTDPSLTLRVYAREMAREDGERERLRALVNGEAPATYEGMPSASNGLSASPM